ncbi:hypothetical protein F5Y04DRAFT_250989 [Hypomontagnella monticulosa]|nr:hypothetical protein F5Y04DRAFT_250989 [Hypomontagnella monticulosa]
MSSLPQDPTRLTTYDSGSHFRFLYLPTEVRLMVYRLLLCHEGKIPFSISFPVRLSPAILRTCRQTLNEARPILYGENVWHMRIIDKGGYGRVLMKKDLQWAHIKQPPWLAHIKSFDISVEIFHEKDPIVIQSEVKWVSEVLSTLPDLHYLRINLNDGHGGTEEDVGQYCRILRSFASIKRVRRVVIDGVPRVYAEHLARQMAGLSPLNDLASMYDGVLSYTKLFDFCNDFLEEAYDAMEEGNVQQFKDVRAKIVAEVDKYMAKIRDDLYHHDIPS